MPDFILLLSSAENCPNLLAIEKMVQVFGIRTAHHAAADARFVGNRRRADLGPHAARAAVGAGAARQRDDLRRDLAHKRDALCIGIRAGVCICLLYTSRCV